MRSRIAAIPLFVCVLLTPVFAQAPKSPKYVSIVQLLATPRKYDGKQVVVFGFLRIQQEGNRLYLGKADFDNVLLANSIWVEVSDDMVNRRLELDKKYVRVEGVFRIHRFGFNPRDAGGITEITTCEAWSDPEHPLSEEIQKKLESNSGAGRSE
jgi:hypothetical protein